MKKNPFSETSFFLLLLVVILLNATTLFNEILESDGTLYACLAKHIATTNNWKDLWVQGADFLDKPHLPFWIAATSFKIFGINAFAYKLPAFIFFIVSLAYCFKLADAIYNKTIAKIATLIYGTALHIIISNFDGKVEIYLTAFILGATFHLYKAFQNKWFWHVVAAALFSALAIMTKGIFALITIMAGFVIYWIKTKQFNQFIQARWYLFIALVLIFIVPELYSLYTQFDLHPEKIVFDKTNISGLKFFFWDSQFGRFFNSGPIKGKGDVSFFLHTTLWAFLPWSVLLLLAMLNKFVKKILPVNETKLIIGGAAFITFILFSLSKFQLPHYVVIIFPHFAMITASYIFDSASEKVIKRINYFQTALLVLVVLLMVWVTILFSFNTYAWMAFAALIIFVSVLFYRPGLTAAAILNKNIGFAVFIAVYLNCIFYPALLLYQGGMMAGKWLNKNQYTGQAALYNCNSFGFTFYYKGNVAANKEQTQYINALQPKDSLLLLCPTNNFTDFNRDSFSIQILNTFPNFRVSQLTGKFINNKTRAAAIDSFTLAMLKRKI